MQAVSDLAITLSIICWPVTPLGMALLYGFAMTLSQPNRTARSRAG